MNEYNAFYMNEWIYMNVWINTKQCILLMNTMHSLWMNEWLQYNALFMNENLYEWIQYNAFFMNEWITIFFFKKEYNLFILRINK